MRQRVFSLVVCVLVNGRLNLCSVRASVNRGERMESLDKRHPIANPSVRIVRLFCRRKRFFVLGIIIGTTMIDLAAADWLHPDRFLYDQAYLDANCNANIVPLNEDNGVDSSVATFSTNYILAALTVFSALALYTKSDKEYAGAFVCLYLLSTGLAFGIAGVGHQLSEEKDERLNRILLPMVSFLGNVGTYALLRVIILFHTKFEGKIRTMWWLVATGMTIYASIVALDNPNPTGIPGFFVILSALITHARQAWRLKEVSVLLKTMGFVVMIIAGAVQLSLASVCGFDGYPDCFQDCPLPAPEFNHNALFHVLAVVFFILYLIGEWLRPAQDCLTVLRRTNGNDRDVDSQLELPPDEKMS